MKLLDLTVGIDCIAKKLNSEGNGMRKDNAISQFLKLLPLWGLLVNQYCFAAGGIVTDGTVGGPGYLNHSHVLNSPNIDITEKMGTRQGANLFHSFKDFNIHNQQAVTFSEKAPNTTENVITRVTGTSNSDINGTLNVTPGGKANFYLINPNGITVGQGGQVNVPGSIHLSTADYLKLSNGQTFSAVNATTVNALYNAEPAAFGFLGTSKHNNGLLKIKNTSIIINQRKTFDAVAGTISLENANVLSRKNKAPLDGTNKFLFFDETYQIYFEKAIDPTNVRLVAINRGAELSVKGMPTLDPTILNAGDIDIKSSNIILTGVNQAIDLWGRDINIANKSLLFVGHNPVDTYRGFFNPLSISIHSNNLTLNSGSKLEFFVPDVNKHNPNNPTKLDITATHNLVLDNGFINANWSDNVISRLIAKGNIELSEGSVINYDFLPGGEVWIVAGGDIKLSDSNIIHRWPDGSAIQGFGKRTLIRGNNITLSNSKIFNEFGELFIFGTGGIFFQGESFQGEVFFLPELGASKSLNLNKSVISSESIKSSCNDCGIILISDFDQVSLINSSITNSSNTANGVENKNLSIILIQNAELLSLVNSNLGSKMQGGSVRSGIYIKNVDLISLNNSSVTAEAQRGHSGDISIEDSNLVSLKNSSLTTSLESSTSNGENGNAGGITVKAEYLVMETGLIQANTTDKNGKAGNVTLDVKALITNGNQLRIGGLVPIDWKRGVFGSNVIQAAAPSGLSGTISSAAPVLNLSGSLSNLGSPMFDNTFLDQNYCTLNSGSSLTRLGKGGLHQKGRDAWLY